jgi:SAM-dependent methyltransferase
MPQCRSFLRGARELFEVISKADLFGWVAEGVPFDPKYGLKAVQDAFILSELRQKKGLRILEFGGGNSRILPLLSGANECWNLDSFDGRDGGPAKPPKMRGVKIVVGRMGDFCNSVPGENFDAIFSVSVLEHVAAEKLGDVLRDCARALRPGGITLHAIDVYMLDALRPDDPHHENVRSRLSLYREAADRAGLTLAAPDRVLTHPYFSSAYASNPDSVMMEWNRSVPQLTEFRKRAQSVSIKAIWKKA